MGELACLFSALAWAVASAVYKKHSARMGPFQVNYFRCVMALVLGLATLAVSGKLGGFSALSLRGLGWASMSGIMARVVGDTLFLLAAGRNGLSGTMPLSSLYPVWATLLALYLSGEALSPRHAAFMALTLAGVILVIRAGLHDAGPKDQSHKIGGYALALGASLAWSLSVLSVKWGSPGLDPVLFNALRMGAGAFVLVIVLTFRREKLLPQGPFPWSLAWASGLESWLGAAAYVYGLAHTPTAVGATLSSIAPVMTIPVASFYLRERISPTLVLGILSALAGVLGLVTR